MTSEVAAALAERLDEDTPFTAAFDDDPLTTLRDGGFAELAEAAEQVGIASASSSHRIYRDEEFRARVEQDPLAELIGWGSPRPRSRRSCSSRARPTTCSIGQRSTWKPICLRGSRPGGDNRRRRRGLCLRPAGIGGQQPGDTTM